MRALLLAAVSIVGLSSMAQAQDVVMRRPLPVDTTSGTANPGGGATDPNGGTPTPTPTPGGSASGPVYGTYSTCSGPGGAQNNGCYELDNDPGLSAAPAAAGACDVAQDAAHKAKLASISTAILGDPDGLTPAGSPIKDLNCAPIPITTGHGWNCYDDGVTVSMECYVVDKASNYAYSDGHPEACSQETNGPGFEQVLGQYGLNAPLYDGSCVKPVYGLTRSCGYTSPPGLYQTITFNGTCFGLNPVSGVVTPAPSYQCQNDLHYSQAQVGQLAAANLYPGGLPDSQNGPDGQPCIGSDAFYLSRLLNSDATSAPSAPDADGKCTATRSLSYQMVCRSGDDFSPDITSCQHQIDLWTQEIASSVPAGGTLASDHYTTTPTANYYTRSYSITYPTDCN